jgi:hypothetical protein
MVSTIPDSQHNQLNQIMSCTLLCSYYEVYLVYKKLCTRGHEVERTFSSVRPESTDEAVVQNAHSMCTRIILLS